MRVNNTDLQQSAAQRHDITVNGFSRHALCADSIFLFLRLRCKTCNYFRKAFHNWNSKKVSYDQPSGVSHKTVSGKQLESLQNEAATRQEHSYMLDSFLAKHCRACYRRTHTACSRSTLAAAVLLLRNSQIKPFSLLSRIISFRGSPRFRNFGNLASGLKNIVRND